MNTDAHKEFILSGIENLMDECELLGRPDIRAALGLVYAGVYCDDLNPLLDLAMRAIGKSLLTQTGATGQDALAADVSGDVVCDSAGWPLELDPTPWG